MMTSATVTVDFFQSVAGAPAETKIRGKNGVLLGNLRNGKVHALIRDLNMITSE